MLGLTVLSPHQDDAVFSLFLALSRWCSSRLSITIANFFTTSSYAPHTDAQSTLAISSVRQKEDLRALFLLSPQIRVESLRLLDAPLRLTISSAAISEADNERLLHPADIHALSQQITNLSSNGLVLAPLALGNHIDHRAVHLAAINLQLGHRLGFYEDLPYATWTSDEQLSQRLTQTERTTQVPLKPVIIRNRSALSNKFRAVSYYNSQITRDEAQAITRFANRYGRGERIWIPKHGKSWSVLASQ